MPWRSHSARFSSKDDGASADAPRGDREIRDRHDLRARTSSGSDTGIRPRTYIV
jgi:hypothetical protein